MKKQNNKWMLIFVVITMSILCLITLSSAFAADISDSSNTALGDTISNVSTQTNLGDSGLNDLSVVDDSSNISLTDYSTDNANDTSTNQITTSNILSAVNDVSSTNQLTSTLSGDTFTNDFTVYDSTTYNNCVFNNSHVTVDNNYRSNVTFNNCTFISNDNNPVLTIYNGKVSVTNCNFYYNFTNSHTIPNAIVETTNYKVTIKNNKFYGYGSESLAINENGYFYVANSISGNIYTYPDTFLAFFYIKLNGYPAIEISSNSTAASHSSGNYYPGGQFYANATVNVTAASKLIDVISGLNKGSVSTNDAKDINAILNSQPQAITDYIKARELDGTINDHISEDFIEEYLQAYYPDYYIDYKNGKLNLTGSGYSVWWYVLKSHSGEWHIDGVIVPTKLLNLIQKQLASVGKLNDYGYANTYHTVVVKLNDTSVSGTINVTITGTGNNANYSQFIPNITVTNGYSNQFKIYLANEGNYTTNVIFTPINSQYYVNSNASYGELIVYPYNTGISNTTLTGKAGQTTNQIANITVTTEGYKNLTVPNGQVTITGPNGYSKVVNFVNGKINVTDLVFPNYGTTNVYNITYNGVLNYLGTIGTITLVSTPNSTSINNVSKTGYYD